VFQIPIAEDFGWLRVEFSLAIAIQNLAWGIGQPIFGALAEKIGDRRTIFAGGLFYAAGLVLSSFAVSPEAHQFYALLIGFGVAGTGFGVILAVVGRASRPEHRSMSLAIATAAGSGGQVIGPPLAEWLLGLMSWPSVFLLFAAAILGSLLILPLMRAPALADKDEIEQSMGEVLRHAMRDPSFAMIFFGFFSCGYQLGFISAHFPAMITEMCGPLAPSSPLNSLGITTTSALGAFALSLIGIANVAGTLLAGHLGNKIAKKYLLSGIYFGRTVIAAVFIMLPITPLSVVVFSATMGTLWLATVPLTSGLIAHLYGLRYMGTLYGIVFFSHQLGSFLGVWLGGRMYDIYGSYTAVWWVGIGVGAFSALVHLPVREGRPVAAAA
jgi:MFS family permease